MTAKQKQIYLSIATVIIIVAYLFWETIFVMTGGDLKAYNAHPYTGGGIDIHFPFVALFMCMLCWLLNYEYRFTITFIMFWLSFINLIDDLFFSNYDIEKAEIGFSLFILFKAYRIYRRKLRENRK